MAIRIGALKDSSLHASAVGTSRLRLLASPAYLERHGAPGAVAQLAQHSLLGFTEPVSLNEWPVREAGGALLRIHPAIRASSGETLRALALQGAGVVCLSDFMTDADRRQGSLVQVLEEATVQVEQSINAVYYRHTAQSARIDSFVRYLKAAVGERAFCDDPITLADS